ncbi:MAG TPA: protein-L-isoaspartate(D-aspartate) O-methyltransferase [Kofleriaceae bacterium]
MLALIACRADPAPPPVAGSAAAAPVLDAADRAAAREQMVRDTIEAKGIRDPRVLAAMRRVPRHELVPAALQAHAYDDTALAIGHEQTISQPYIVAAMTEAAHVGPGKRVLEIGTGSGYQTAVLAELGADVYSIEILEPLAKRAAADLARLGYTAVHLRTGDGYRGWPEAAPFDAIVVTAAPLEVPQPLVDQLAVGGRLVIPIGRDDQVLKVLTRTAAGIKAETMFDVRFVPMTGQAAADARTR